MLPFHKPRILKLNTITLIVITLGVFLLAVRSAHEPWTAMRIAAVILGLPSLVPLVVARIELGGSFSIRPKAQTLVTHGLYSRLRNPIYLRKPLGVSLLAVIIPLQMYRARKEEKVLETKFGEEYRQYKARTWF